MSWAGRRRFVILLILGAIAAAFLIIVGIATFYKTPSCTDNVQNQDEAGIDCGGSCQYLCVAQQQPPTVLFTKALQNGAGRIDVVALVENKNAVAAAKDVPYRIRLYGSGQILIQEMNGTFDLPPGATIPVYVPNIVSGKQSVVNAFLDIDPSSPQWFSMTTDIRVIPAVSNATQGGTVDAPRVEATLVNGSASTLTNVPVVVLIRDVRKEVIATSQTVVPLIPAQGTATATFTWQGAFSAAPASIEVIPVIPLP